MSSPSSKKPIRHPKFLKKSEDKVSHAPVSKKLIPPQNVSKKLIPPQNWVVGRPLLNVFHSSDSEDSESDTEEDTESDTEEDTESDTEEDQESDTEKNSLPNFALVNPPLALHIQPLPLQLLTFAEADFLSHDDHTFLFTEVHIKKVMLVVGGNRCYQITLENNPDWEGCLVTQGWSTLLEGLDLREGDKLYLEKLVDPRRYCYFRRTIPVHSQEEEEDQLVSDSGVRTGPSSRRLVVKSFQRLVVTYDDVNFLTHGDPLVLKKSKRKKLLMVYSSLKSKVYVVALETDGTGYFLTDGWSMLARESGLRKGSIIYLKKLGPIGAFLFHLLTPGDGSETDSGAGKLEFDSRPFWRGEVEVRLQTTDGEV